MLFQPREFLGGLKKTDGKTVRDLAHSIGIYGELDPVLVIKLGEEFVCVDGHHRLEAYKKTKRTQAIKCEWFPGRVQHAVDESMRRNAKTKLNVPKEDKMEEAWKRVLLGQGSKKQIALLCDVSPRSVATMRQVKSCDDEPGERRDEFRRNLGLDEKRTLMDVSWSSARMAWQGMERKTITEEEEAKALAQRIGQKLEGLLSRNHKVTARALEVYDADLPKGLIRAWRAQWPFLAPDGEEWPDEEQLANDLSPDEKLGVIGAPQATGSTEGAGEPPGPLGPDGGLRAWRVSPMGWEGQHGICKCTGWRQGVQWGSQIA